MNTFEKLKPHIRWMIRADMVQVLDIEFDSFECPWLNDDFIRVLRKRNIIGMVAEVADMVAGYMVYSLDTRGITLINLGVGQEYRRRGVGAALVNKLKGKLSERRPILTTQVRETNLAAHKFFAGCGLTCTGIEREYYIAADGADEDAYTFQFNHLKPAERKP